VPKHFNHNYQAAEEGSEITDYFGFKQEERKNNELMMSYSDSYEEKSDKPMLSQNVIMAKKHTQNFLKNLEAFKLSQSNKVA